MNLLKILTIVAILSCTVFPQLNDTTYSLSTEIGVGYSRYFTTMEYDKLNKNGFSGTLKIMWNPEHLLSIGLETGYQYIYSFNYDGYETEFGTTDLSASMYTVPVFIIFSMKILPNIKLSAGSGVYLLYNSGEAFGDNLSSSQLSIGAHTGISYTYPINESIAVGGELLYSYFSKLQDQTFALQFVLVYKFLEW